LDACEFNVDQFALQLVRYVYEWEEFKKRTMAFAMRVVRLVVSQPKSEFNYVIGKQLLRAATSVGANYRSACRAKSRADFISKMTTVEEECDESLYWMELMVRAGVMKRQALEELMKEANEILSLVVASIRSDLLPLSTGSALTPAFVSIRNPQ
jgi:four helix bundle protein